MKKLTFALFAVCAMVCLTFTSCKKPIKEDPKKTLKELIQGKSWKLGTVRKGATDVTANFTGFLLTFNADATTGTITTGGSASTTNNVTYGVSTNTITVNGMPIITGWPGTLTEASSNDPDGTTFSFKVNINNPKTGPADHVFNLVKN